MHTDLPSLDHREGSAAVDGTFVVDAVTGKVVKKQVDRVPFPGTRIVAHDDLFVCWLKTGDFVAVTGKGGGSEAAELQLSVIDRDGRVKRTVPLGAAASVTDALGQTGLRLRLTTRTEGDVTASRLEIVDDRSAKVTRVPDEDFGEFRVVRHVDWSPATGRIYFTTEIDGPRYGMWATEFRLWSFDLSTAQTRPLKPMPVDRFFLSPDGRYALYNHTSTIVPGRQMAPGDCSLVDLGP